VRPVCKRVRPLVSSERVGVKSYRRLCQHLGAGNQSDHTNLPASRPTPTSQPHKQTDSTSQPASQPVANCARGGVIWGLRRRRASSSTSIPSCSTTAVSAEESAGRRCWTWSGPRTPPRSRPLRPAAADHANTEVNPEEKSRRSPIGWRCRVVPPPRSGQTAVAGTSQHPLPASPASSGSQHRVAPAAVRPKRSQGSWPGRPRHRGGCHFLGAAPGLSSQVRRRVLPFASRGRVCRRDSGIAEVRLRVCRVG